MQKSDFGIELFATLLDEDEKGCMSKELLIMRHAKSSWADSGMSDYDRPLNERGMRDAPRMAAYLVDCDLKPDLIISSSANRAATTAKLLNQQFDLEPDCVVFEDSLYLARPKAYLDALSLLAGGFSRPMVIGHNPGLESLVFHLTGEAEVVPTACVSHVLLGITDWEELNNSDSKLGELLSVFRPKQLF